VPRTLIADLKDKLDQAVELRGWVQAVRDQKRVQFVILRDRTGLAQIVLEKPEQPSELNDAVSALTPESAVRIEGEAIADERVKLGGVEVRLQHLQVEAAAEPELPVTPESALEKRIDWRYLDLRRPDRRLIFEVQTTVEHAMREHWLREGFIEIHTPKLMGSASESGAELFRVEYFDRTAYLAQSPQFYKQMAMSAGFDRVFEIAPVFRANPSFTSRHDTEFTSVDVEIAWIDSHEDVMAFEERWLAAVFATVAERHGEAIKETFGVDVVVPSVPFPRISLDEAKRLLRDHDHELSSGSRGREPQSNGPDLRSEGGDLQSERRDLGPDDDLDPPSERALSAIIEREQGHEFAFVTDYPVAVRPFYHMRHPHDPGLTRSFDLLWRGIEITTGAQREHRYEQLLTQAREKDVDLPPIGYYLDFFRYGPPPHGGFGFGLTRLLMRMLGQDNVREVTFLYRGPNRLSP
jgi:aspartyl-tRNA synthetase